MGSECLVPSLLSRQCPDSACKQDLLAYLQRIALYCHQLNICSKVKAEVQNLGGELVVSGVSLACQRGGCAGGGPQVPSRRLRATRLVTARSPYCAGLFPCCFCGKEYFLSSFLSSREKVSLFRNCRDVQPFSNPPPPSRSPSMLSPLAVSQVTSHSSGPVTLGEQGHPPPWKPCGIC